MKFMKKPREMWILELNLFVPYDNRQKSNKCCMICVPCILGIYTIIVPTHILKLVYIHMYGFIVYMN